MYIAKIENKSGQSVTLSQNETAYQIMSITGLNPSPAQINLSESVTMSGGRFNSAHVGSRNIVINMKLNGNAEANRIALYNMFRPGDPCKFYFQSGTRNVRISGYVELCDVGIFEQSEEISASIICPFPYFEKVTANVTETTGAAVIITTTSDVSIGFDLVVTFITAATSLKITKTATGEYIAVTDTFAIGDTVTISTIPGQKALKKTSNNITTNLFPKIDIDSTFFQFDPGANRLEFEISNVANNDNARFYFTRRDNYQGV